jgi:hypothetical protein
VISSSQRPLPDNTQPPPQTNIHAPGGIRNHDRSRRADANLRLRPRGHWDRQSYRVHFSKMFLVQNMSCSDGGRSWVFTPSVLLRRFGGTLSLFLRLTDSFKFGWIFQHRPEPNSATLKMEVKRYFETSEQPKYTKRCQGPKDDRHLKNNGREKKTLNKLYLRCCLDT